MKKICLSIFIYIVFLAALLPANVAMNLISLPSGVTVSGVNGSIWAGRVETVKLLERQLDQVRWELSPWALLLGTAQLDFQFGSRATPVSAKGQVAWSMAGISVNNLRFEAPVGFLLGDVRLPLNTEITGEVNLIIDTLSQGEPWCEQLNGELLVNHTQVSNQFGVYPLGAIELELSCIAGKVQLATDDRKNQLGIVGSLQLAANNHVALQGKIKPTMAQPADMRNSLSMLGKSDSEGFYPIAYQGYLPAF